MLKATISKPPCCIRLLLHVCISASRAYHLSVGVNKRCAIGYSTICSWLHLAAEFAASFHCGGVFTFSTLIIISLIATLDTRS
ncbi:hypothetical protein BU25DRAFT_149571 [Macroventuria anomochaeta]|uniref:Uncharacterized protein n=1 Tax=Macroventuria anomochaeta TaxID=301207 RepID=A0ACB6SFE6_9PLEO|nr:uncharacterized protein BU25DRAFT_149571 [Macroventuria anomochaeta]KAF2632335.1 hypothetical protein BU25DRAFT_149571 [Macroventuria anomochaeta]